MAKYRPIKTSFWDDDYILDLKSEEKLLFLFILTNPNTSLCGIYKLSIGYIYRITGIPKEKVTKILQKFIEDKKIRYFQDWIYIINARKHQTKSPKIDAGILRELNLVPHEIKDALYCIDTLSIGIDKPELKLEPELKPNSFNKELSKQKFSEDSIELKLSNLLWEKILHNIPTAKKPNLQKWAAEVDKMLKTDSRSPEQIRVLIEWSQQSDFWKANILSTAKLRKHFDTLAAQAIRQHKQATSNVAFISN